jgi:methyl-accepting chemotaxis protein
MPQLGNGRLQAIGGAFTLTLGSVLLLVMAVMALNYFAAERKEVARQRAAAIVEADHGLDAMVRSIYECFISAGSSSSVANAGRRSTHFASAVGRVSKGLLSDAQVGAAHAVHARARAFLEDPDAMNIENVDAMVALGKWIVDTGELSAQLSDLARDEREVAERASAQARIASFAVGAMMLATVAGIFLMFYLRVTRPLMYAMSFTRSVSDGDLTVSLSTKRSGQAASLFGSLAGMSASLKRIVANVRGGAATLADTVEKINDWNAELTQRTQEHATTLEEIAASMESLTEMVRQSNARAGEAATLAQDSAQQAEQGGSVIRGSLTTLQRIRESSARISDIVSLIDGIAFQTNILALNAAVEAARAGEHGRGFSVVAGEVRSLAQRSAQAAKDIKSLISQSAATVEQGAAEGQKAGAMLDAIVQSFGHLAEQVTDIAQISSEQRGGIEQINTALAAMNANTHANANLVERARDASDALEAEARTLVEAIARFRIDQRDEVAALPAGA